MAKGGDRSFILFIISMTVLASIQTAFLMTTTDPTYKLLSTVIFFVVITGLAAISALWSVVYKQIVDRIRLAYPKRLPERVVDPYTEMGLWVFVRKIPIINEITVRFSERLKKHMIKSGYYANPLYYSSFYMLLSIALTPLTLIGIVGLLQGNVFYTLLLLVPLIPLFFPFIELGVRRVNRSSDVESELPYFMIYASLLHRAGISLFDAFMKLIGTKEIFSVMEREARIIRREYAFYSHSPIRSLEKYAFNHPNEDLKGIVLGYTSVLRSGGDTGAFLERKASEQLERLKMKWKNFVKTVMIYGDMAILVTMMVPSIIILGSLIFAQSVSFNILVLYGVLGLPFFTVVFIGIFNASQPKMKNIFSVKKPLLYFIPTLMLATPIVILYGVSWELIPGVICIISLLPVAIAFHIQYMEIMAIERALPAFMRDLTEFVKIGYDIVKAIVVLPSRRKYNRIFDAILAKISILLRLNTPLRVISTRLLTRSWLLKYVLFLLDEVTSTGGISPTILEYFTEMLTENIRVKREARGQLRVYVIILLMAPVLLGALLAMTSYMIQPFAEIIEGPTFYPIQKEVLEVTMKFSKLVIVETGMMVGLIIAKVYDQTIFSLRWVIIGAIIGLLSITVVPTVMEMFITF